MRIHTSATMDDVRRAAATARVGFTRLSEHKSQSRDRAFEVILNGESRRRQNGGPDYAATWDQWGVFLAALFEVDPETKCWAYDGADAFATRTADRFGAPEVEMTSEGYVERFKAYGWPEDAHGDHRFQYQGTPREQSCTTCSAVTRW